MRNRAADEVLDLSQLTGEPDSSRENESEVLIPVDPAPAASCRCGCGGINSRHIKIAAYSLPVASALNEVIQTAIDLVGKPVWFVAIVGTANGAASLSLTAKFNN